MARCKARHPSHPQQVRCEEQAGHEGQHFHSFYMRSWSDEEPERPEPIPQRPAVLAGDRWHDWLPVNASLQECQQCCEVRAIPDDCMDCQTVADCYRLGHGGGTCPAGFDLSEEARGQ